MKAIAATLIIFVIGGAVAFGWRQYTRSTIVEHVVLATPPAPEAVIPVVESEPIPVAAHITMPTHVRGMYISGWTAGSKKNIDRLVELAKAKDINSVVIDIKDATGKLSYQPIDEALRVTGVGTRKIADLPELIERLHGEGIYVIGRVAVFQDPYRATLHPEDAFRNKTTGGVWRDDKGLAWLRADAESVWEYTVAIAHDAYAQGFDEINVDYVRYPSDGNLDTIENRAGPTVRAETIEQFFVYLDEYIRGVGIPLSADLFGLTMTAVGDIGIGQELLRIAPHVDIIAPMIYPSHFAPESYGISSPAEHPYEIIEYALADGINKLATIGIGPEKLRPWLQDFDLLGVPYTPAMVADQIRATEEHDIPGWLIWDPKNTYTGLGGI